MLHHVRWTPQKITQRIELITPYVYRNRHPLPDFRYKSLEGPLQAPLIGIDVDDRDWEIIKPKTYWGTWMTDFMLRTTFQVPADWDKNQPISLYLPLGDAGDFSHPETLAYIDGEPYAAADRHHHEIRLAEAYCDGQPHTLALHGWTGLGGYASNDPDTKLYMKECAVVQVDVPTQQFVAAARVAMEVVQQLEDNDPVKGRIYNALDAAFKVLDTRDPLGTDAFYNSVPDALKTLKEGIAAAGDPMNVDIVGVGHAHIDVAWLWTLGQTVRKSGRTFSTVLRLMEEFPEYKFTQSQPQLYKYTEQYYPTLFEQIKERVKEGRWEIIGGAWVEPDCNAIGAESLARQFLLGRSYFRHHFGDVETPVLWLPDTFGYSWALPQLIKQAGMKYFITHKMSWNQFNQMPHQLLWWQGLDGTKVLTHFLTTPSGFEFLPHSTTYNGLVDGKEVFGTWTNFHQKEVHNELMTAYGYGDGGGGPNREMLENIRELNNHPGAPRVRPGTIREFMDRVENEVADQLPTWNGEFYLEYHRGTYTSQAKNKRNNRKSEFLMHDAEFLATLAALVTDYDYPQEDINQAWELICLNQFHDILPGSSITPVYIDSDRDYATIRELGEKVIASAVEALTDPMPDGTTILAANPTSFGGTRIGLLPEQITSGRQIVDLITGKTLASQIVEGGTLVEFPKIAAHAVIPLTEEDSSEAAVNHKLTVKQDGIITLENDLLRVEISQSGDITRIYDKEAGRDVLADGETGNALLAFEDRPLAFDAWDIDIFIEDRVEKVEGVERVAVTENGPLRATVEVQRSYRSSKIVQKIHFYHDSKRLDFDTWVDWHEQHILLKAAFPVNVMNTTATFDVQWGNVQRTTHRNTSWDWARFETCAHKWADLSEGNYGVALLNDCKYGHDVHDNVLRLTLIKSATMPDPQADQGEHVFTYSLLPHTGDWRNDVVPQAYSLNNPLILRRVRGGSSASKDLKPMFKLDAQNVIIETIKRAEDGHGIIVRLYENERNRGTVTLETGFKLAEAHICNLLEENETQLNVSNNRIALDVTPYKIINLRLIPAT